MDHLSPESRSANMRAVKNRDTEPERIVRKLSYSLGYRFRLHDSKLPCKPDVVFRARRKAIFVHGCFWHHHNCRHGLQIPKTNTAFWKKKIAKNVERDAKAIRSLRKIGWRSLVIWECETRIPSRLVPRLRRFLG